MKNTGSSFEIVLAKTINVLTRGNFLYFKAISIRDLETSVLILNKDSLRKIVEDIILPKINDVSKNTYEGLKRPKNIMKIWVEIIW